jgi:hypothetical protein
MIGGCCSCGGPPPRMERERGASAECVLPTPFCLVKHAIGFNRWQLCVVCSNLVTASVGFGPLAAIVTTLFSLWGRGCSVAFDSGDAVQAWQWWVLYKVAMENHEN